MHGKEPLVHAEPRTKSSAKGIYFINIRCYYFIERSGAMKKTALIKSCLMLVAAGGIVAAVTLPAAKAEATSPYQTLVWADEFDSGTQPSGNNWTYNTGGGGWGNNELETYTSSPSTANISNGVLNIVARYSKRKPHYTSARLLTRDKFSWQYGRIDVRAKLPTGVGSWPAIWMLPADSKYGTQYLANGEIDLMEEVGADQNQIVSSAHSLLYNPANSNTRDAIYI